MSRIRLLLTAALALSAATPALAHHMMGGALPSTFAEGLLSGLGHPIIGHDHLLAILAVGALAALFTRGVLLPVGFVAAALLGVGLHVGLVDLPAAELLIAVSLLVLGALLLAQRVLVPARALVILFALAGVAHGYAFGESIVGAEPAPLVAYLLGLGLVQTGIALVGWAGAQALARRVPDIAPWAMRGFALLVMVVGVTALAAGA
jgi:urease accessory protein